MRKYLLIPILLFLLVACGAAEESAPAVTTDDAKNDTPAVEADAPAEKEESVVEEPVTFSSSPEEAGKIRSRDWTKGAAEPVVTIIEYGDFQ